ncbi:MAG: hypothetical protein IKA55_07450 [Akkermansia sp.]|nr:hypothetical protein [Akkermansia sp.]
MFSSIDPQYRRRIEDPLWRLCNLYWIENMAGRMQRFAPNAAQLRLHRNLWHRNVVLKARQLGISTYVAMLMLDRCLFVRNFHAGIIDKTLPDAEQKLEKIRFAWENLDYLPPNPEARDYVLASLGGLIKQKSGASKKGSWHPAADARGRLAFANGSDIRLGTTLRGGTLQLLHVSELAHVSMHAPWRAREIRTGAINTVPAEGTIILESTHEGGRYGVNYELTTQAMENCSKEELLPLDFRFFFMSWFDNPDYSLPGRAGWSDAQAAYFEKLEQECGVQLTHGQKLWYARMERTMGAAMRQEYPSTPDEAFATGNDGAIYGAQIARLREQGRIGANFEYNPQEPLYTAWDLGLSDHTAIWLVQNWGGNVYWLNHYAANQLPLEHFAGKIREWELSYGAIAAHFLPHDAAHRDPHGHSYVESLAREGIHAVRVVPRTPDIWRGINSLRGVLKQSWFHRDTLQQRVNPRGEKEPSGLSCLERYRTAPAGASGTYRETPVHDACSHSADAARMFAEALSHGMVYPVQLRLTPRRARM